MSQSTATRRRRAVAYADSRPLTGTNSAAFALTFLLIIGCVTDVQGVALLPLLGKMEAALHLSGAETSWAINSLSIATAVMVGLSARSADVFGHRKVLIPMLSFGVVGSVLCALANSFALGAKWQRLRRSAIPSPIASESANLLGVAVAPLPFPWAKSAWRDAFWHCGRAARSLTALSSKPRRPASFLSMP